jgi:hypothetical protein
LIIDPCQHKGAAKYDHIEKRNQAHGHRLRCGEQVKAKGSRKGSGQTMERDEKAGSRGLTGIASQALLPGKTPMGTLCPRADPPSR